MIYLTKIFTMIIKKLSIDSLLEFIQLLQIFQEVFEITDQIVDNKQLSKLLSSKDFMVFVSKVDNKIVGGLTIYVLQNYFNKKPTAYINDLAVKPEFQRQGIGQKLIAEVIQYCKYMYFEEIYVAAECIDEQAISFYKRTNYNNEVHVKLFSYKLDI
jgi:aminoglycoside 3-N-acetyltransferase I